jgi:hypothetical protein
MRFSSNVLSNLPRYRAGSEFSLGCDLQRHSWSGVTKINKRGLENFDSTLNLAAESVYPSEILSNVRVIEISQRPLDCSPNLITALARPGGKRNDAIFAEYALNASQTLFQLVVRQLIGFCGNY